MSDEQRPEDPKEAEAARAPEPVAASEPLPAARSEPEPVPVPASTPAPETQASESAAARPAEPAPALEPSGSATPPPPKRRSLTDALAEPPEIPVEVSRKELTSQSRRAFLLSSLGLIATAVGAWWLLPDRTKGRLLPAFARDRLDTLAARVGLSPESRERALDKTLTFDDDVSEALYSKDRRVRTYTRSDVTRLPNNYHGATPGPDYLPSWALNVSGLASGKPGRFTIQDLLARFPHHEQVTRLVCVEGWSAIAWWGGIRFADLLAAFPPAPGMRWAAMRSTVSLDLGGRPEPYYVSIDMETARHPQALLATHLDGRPLPLAHGAPLRLLAPMKLGLKNIKAITDIEYTATEPPDYWNERGYSKYDGL